MGNLWVNMVVTYENDRVAVVAVEQMDALNALDYLPALVHDGSAVNLSKLSLRRRQERRSNIDGLVRAGDGSSQGTRKERGESEEGSGLHFGWR